MDALVTDLRDLATRYAADSAMSALMTEAADELERLRFAADYFRIWADAVARSVFDTAPCRVCGLPVVCLPDGLPLCEPCAERDGDIANAPHKHEAYE